MENQLNTIEEVQVTSQEQLTALHTGFNQLNQDNLEMKLNLQIIKDFLERDLQGSIREAVKGLQQSTTEQSSITHHVSVTPQTPTHFATYGDSSLSSDPNKSRSVNWEDPPKTSTNQTLGVNSKLIELYALPEFQFILNNQLSSTSNPHHNPSLQQRMGSQIVVSTLNPFAQPVYPTMPMFPTVLPQTRYSTPISTPHIAHQTTQPHWSTPKSHTNTNFANNSPTPDQDTSSCPKFSNTQD